MGAALAWVYDHGEVLNRESREGGIRLTVQFDAADIPTVSDNEIVT